jgi:polyribonucleotide nucleotidyltransferase
MPIDAEATMIRPISSSADTVPMIHGSSTRLRGWPLERA